MHIRPYKAILKETVYDNQESNSAECFK